MNRNKYLLGALGALVLIVAAVFILTNRGNNNETEPIAVVTDNGAPAENEGVAPTEQAADESTEVADLPPLPVLENTQATGMGGGGGAATSARPQSGGGGFAAEDAAIRFLLLHCWMQIKRILASELFQTINSMQQA